MNLEPDYSDFLGCLTRNKVQFVIVGAFALAHHGAPRATGAFDVWVRPLPANAKAVLRALRDFGAPVAAVSEDDILAGKVIQLGVEPVRIALLTELDGVTAEEIWKGKIRGRVGPHRVHFIGRKIFVKNKLAAGRRKDLADLEALGELGPVSRRK